MMRQKPPEISKRFLFYVPMLAHHLYVLWFCSMKLDITGITDRDVITMLKYGPIYLTCWNFGIQMLYFGVALWYDVLSVLPEQQKLKNTVLRWKSYIYLSLFFPYGLFVSLVYWSLYHVEKELVNPLSCQKFYPTWLNHSLHTVVLVVVVIEAFISRHPPQSFKTLLTGNTLLYFTYAVVLIISRIALGYYIYPFFNLMTVGQLAAAAFLYYLVNIGFIFVGTKVEKLKSTLTKNQNLVSKML